MRRLVLLSVLSLVVLALPSESQARPLHTGFVDNVAFYDVSPDVGNLWLKRARHAGGSSCV